MKKVLGIFRATCYSPGMAKHDEAILRAVAQRLENAGYAISLIHEEEFSASLPIPDMVLHMTRSSQALDILQGWKESGCRVINTVESVRSVERSALARLCAEQHIPTPKTWIVDTIHSTTLHTQTTNGSIAPITFPCWVKRAGSCAQSSDDVCRVADAEAYSRCLTQLHTRGIIQAVVMEHIEGLCIKFYAVKGTDFFHCLPAYNKWDILSHSSTPHPWDHKKSQAAIKHSILSRVEVSDTTPVIYGGDAIIAPDGTAYLIDLNDWPSFSTCREAAATAIVQTVGKG